MINDYGNACFVVERRARAVERDGPRVFKRKEKVLPYNFDYKVHKQEGLKKNMKITVAANDRYMTWDAFIMNGSVEINTPLSIGVVIHI